MAKARKAQPATRKKVPRSRLPQRSEMVAGKEDVEGVEPIPAAKAKKPVANRKTGRR